MAFSINTNINSLWTQASMKKNEARLDTTLERLSSGLRINGAKDDAAGLAISNRLTAQIRGSQVAVRNTMDGLSLAQTAEGAIGSITDILLHVRDLAIRSNNGALSSEDVSYIQQEVSEQLTEIDRIVDVTRFSGRKIFTNLGQIGYGARTGTQEEGDTVDGLRGFWLTESEKLVEKYYGLTGDGADMKVKLYSADDGKGAYVSYNIDGSGKAINQTLAVNLHNVDPTPPDGGSDSSYYLDRVALHEMTHAIMGRTMNFNNLPKWFKEGTAEFIQGAKERVKNSLQSLTSTQLATNLNSDAAWANNSDEYSASYLAVRFLHQKIKDNGGKGIIDVMNYLKADTAHTLNGFFSTYTSAANYFGTGTGTVNSETSFRDMFHDNTGAAAVTFIDSISLTGEDTGAIGGADVDGGAIRTPESVVPNKKEYSEQPLKNFNLVWDEAADSFSGQDSVFSMQVGTIKGEKIDIAIQGLDVQGMGLKASDIADNPDKFVAKVDAALTQIDGVRANLGATQNRLVSTVNNTTNIMNNLAASNSRIQDADFAVETASLTKSQIIAQAASSMLVQANMSKQAVLSLLK